MANPPKTPVTTTPTDAPARLSEDAGFEGQWKGGDAFIQGRFEGELTLTGQLRVGRTGSVLGRVHADSAEIGGEFTGEVHARLIVMTEGARARGTFVSERLSIKEGAVVDGAFDRPKRAVGTETIPVRPIPDKAKTHPKEPAPADAIPEKAKTQADEPAPPPTAPEPPRQAAEEADAAKSSGPA